MVVYTTAQQLQAETDPEFPVDVVVRQNGTLTEVWELCDWHLAVECGLAALSRGLQVEIVESDGVCIDGPFFDELDRQD